MRSGILLGAGNMGRGWVVAASSSGLNGGSGGREPDGILVGGAGVGDGFSTFIFPMDIFFRNPHLLCFSLPSFALEGRRTLEGLLSYDDLTS